MQCLARLRQLRLLAAIGQHAVVADALDAARQHIQQEAADELWRRQRDTPFAALVVRPSRKRPFGGAHGLVALVADRRLMGLWAQVLQHLGGPAQRCPGIDHPRLAQEV